jgi:hypothetical protein
VGHDRRRDPAAARRRRRPAGLLRAIAGGLEEAARVEADARSATAQARFTAWLVALLPVGAAVLAELADPGYVVALLRAPLAPWLLGPRRVCQLAPACSSAASRAWGRAGDARRWRSRVARGARARPPGSSSSPPRGVRAVAAAAPARRAARRAARAAALARWAGARRAAPRRATSRRRLDAAGAPGDGPVPT